MSASPAALAALSALVAPRRREILRLVWDAERTAGAIRAELPDVTFGAVSQHLRILRDAGLVACRTSGRERLYRARRSVLGGLRAVLEAHWADSLYRLKLIAELEAARRGPRAPRFGRPDRGRPR